MILQAPGCGADRSGGDVRRGDLLLGKVCLGVTRGDTLVVRIEDDSGRRVGGVIKVSWSRFSTDHDFIRPFCGTSGPLPVVAGYLTVHLDAPGDVRGAHAHGGPGCTEIRPLGRNTGATTQGATVGRVRVTFTGEEKGPT